MHATQMTLAAIENLDFWFCYFLVIGTLLWMILVRPKKKQCKPKLFLSWMAMRNAVRKRRVEIKDLESCLFCLSLSELVTATRFDREVFDHTWPALVRAAWSGRVAYFDDSLLGSRTLILTEINALLELNGGGKLVCRRGPYLRYFDLQKELPRVADDSFEVLWSDQPNRGELRDAMLLQVEQRKALAKRGIKPFNYAADLWLRAMHKQFLSASAHFFPSVDAVDAATVSPPYGELT